MFEISLPAPKPLYRKLIFVLSISKASTRTIPAYLQRLADAAVSGHLNGPVDAKIQGPYDGHNMAGYEVDTYTRKLVISGGVGIAAVLPMLKRMALHMEASHPNGMAAGVE